MSWLFSESRISPSKNFSYANRSFARRLLIFVSKPNWSPLILSWSIHKNGLWHVPYFTEFFTCGQAFGLKIRTNRDKWRQTCLKWFLPSYNIQPRAKMIRHKFVPAHYYPPAEITNWLLCWRDVRSLSESVCLLEFVRLNDTIIVETDCLNLLTC